MTKKKTITIIVVVVLLFVIIVAGFLWWPLAFWNFQGRYTYPFHNSTFQSTTPTVMENCTIEKMEVALTEMPADKQSDDTVNTITNRVDKKRFAIEVNITVSGVVYKCEFTQLESGPVPIRPDFYFASIDMRDCGLDIVTCCFDFLGGDLGVFIYDYKAGISLYECEQI